MTPLGRIVREMIGADGPISVRDYMALCLAHPSHGYYMTRDPIGATGDFTTAPEISQMFGELLGLWAAETWNLMGRPDRVRLVELGPGRGTLMADALRAAGAMPGFRDALSVHLVETSPILRTVQERVLDGIGGVTWHEHLRDIPPGPALVLANEFLDALPIRQFVRAQDGWHERLVGLGPDGALAFGLSSHPELRIAAGGRTGDVLELAEAASDLVGDLAARLARDGGAALIVDYGHLRTGYGDTLQALRRHAFTDPLAEPGEVDLTAHVDFAALARVAAAAEVQVHGPALQGEFLRALGIEHRAARLKADATPPLRVNIDAALARLTGAGDGQMGKLFKVIGLTDARLAALPGLPAPARHATASKADARREEAAC